MYAERPRLGALGSRTGVSVDDAEDVNWEGIHTLLLSLGSRLGGGLAGGGLFLRHVG